MFFSPSLRIIFSESRSLSPSAVRPSFPSSSLSVACTPFEQCSCLAGCCSLSPFQGYSKSQVEIMSDTVSPALKNLPKVAGDLKSELEGFNHSCMKKAETSEKNVLPSAEDLAAEKNQQTLIAGIEHFDTSRLKHTQTQEKNPLPDKDAIQQEKGKQELISGIENFDPAKLKHAETLEKNPLPTREIIAAEKISA